MQKRFERKIINRRGEEIFLICDRKTNQTQITEFPATGIKEVTVVNGSLEATENTLVNIGFFVEGEVIGQNCFENGVEFDPCDVSRIGRD